VDTNESVNYAAGDVALCQFKKHAANYVSLGHVDVECPLGVRNGYATN